LISFLNRSLVKDQVESWAMLLHVQMVKCEGDEDENIEKYSILLLISLVYNLDLIVQTFDASRSIHKISVQSSDKLKKYP